MKQALEICRAAEVSEAQLKAVGDKALPVNAVRFKKNDQRHTKKTEHKPVTTTGAGKSGKSCGNCGMSHEPKACPAFGKVCHHCGKENHFTRVCRQKLQKTTGKQQYKKAHFIEEDAPVYCVTDGKLGKRGIVTLQVDVNRFIQFHVDTGAECNVLPLHIYCKATGDHNKLTQIVPNNSSIILYRGARKQIVGKPKFQSKTRVTRTKKQPGTTIET